MGREHLGGPVWDEGRWGPDEADPTCPLHEYGGMTWSDLHTLEQPLLSPVPGLAHMTLVPSHPFLTQKTLSLLSKKDVLVSAAPPLLVPALPSDVLTSEGR